MRGAYFEMLDDLDYPPGSRRVANSPNPDLLQGIELPARWYLGAPISTDASEIFIGEEFSIGVPQDVRGALTVEIDYDGLPLDFTFASVDMPVLSVKAAEIVRDLAPADVHLVPASIRGRTADYFIMNVTRLIDCIDRERSDIQYWPRTGGVWRGTAGKPRMVVELRVDPGSVPKEVGVFRIADWVPPVIVSEEIRAAFVAQGVSGIQFNCVS